jgi:two-component system sensor histidine kinase ChiS
MGFLLFIISQSLILSRRSALSFKTIEGLTLTLKDLNKSLSRFVPFQFLEYLNKDSILDVKLGDQALKNMTILFADIRSFTSLSEAMTPEENFKFINSFLTHVVPVIREGGGFVDKFMGDGIMALFPQSADKGLEAAINLQKAVDRYNTFRKKSGYRSIKLGIGLHSGGLILGTIGETDRMETTVISDTVNVASRMEQLTKAFGSSIIISEDMVNSLQNPEQFVLRNLGSTKVKGKRYPLVIYEVLDSLPAEEKDKKAETMPLFEEGVNFYKSDDYNEALNVFLRLKSLNPDDKAVEVYLSQCRIAVDSDKK